MRCRHDGRKHWVEFHWVRNPVQASGADEKGVGFRLSAQSKTLAHTLSGPHCYPVSTSTFAHVGLRPIVRARWACLTRSSAQTARYRLQSFRLTDGRPNAYTVHYLQWSVTSYINHTDTKRTLLIPLALAELTAEQPVPNLPRHLSCPRPRSSLVHSRNGAMI